MTKLPTTVEALSPGEAGDWARPESDGNSDTLNDVLLVVDLLSDFAHHDGVKLRASFARRSPVIASRLERARRHGVPVVYANDNAGLWQSDAGGAVRRAMAGPEADRMEALAPQPEDRFVLKPRYSAFDHTPLELILDELGCERVQLFGMTTEGCVAQTAIAARERGLKVTVLADACATVDPWLERTALAYLVDVAGVHVERMVGTRIAHTVNLSGG
jgi:nicotinamidase-related amidase